MLKIKHKKSFEKDIRRIEKRGKLLSKLGDLAELLIKEQQLSYKYRDHVLIGNYMGYRECHIEPDWLLIYDDL